MNRYGFGGKEVIAFLAVIGISLLIVGMLYNDIENNSASLSGNNNKTFSTNRDNKSSENEIKTIEASSYSELENIIAEASLSYFSHNSNNDVSLLTLIQNNYIDTIYSLDKDKVDCNGYVEYNHEYEEAKTYLMCGNKYTTVGYDINKEINY